MIRHFILFIRSICAVTHHQISAHCFRLGTRGDRLISAYCLHPRYCFQEKISPSQQGSGGKPPDDPQLFKLFQVVLIAQVVKLAYPLKIRCSHQGIASRLSHKPINLLR